MCKRVKFPFSVFIVSENSMLPTYKSDDHVVTFNWGKVRRGKVIVFRVSRSLLAGASARRDLDQCYIKRVVSVKGNRVYVAGDNKKASANMLAIFKSQVIGRVICKY